MRKWGKPRGLFYRIHWGSSVTTSPGVTIELLEVLERLEGRVSSMEVSPSESWEASLSLLYAEWGGLAGAGRRMVKGILMILLVSVLLPEELG